MANVQISEELFLNLVKYHICGLGGLEEPIEKGLQEKFDSMVNRQLYSNYKDKSLSAEERESARREYLERKGIPESFRW